MHERIHIHWLFASHQIQPFENGSERIMFVLLRQSAVSPGVLLVCCSSELWPSKHCSETASATVSLAV